ncbi:MAG: hypothetical protein N3A61_03090 [Ignavibacteria bacterium]|nr:hypothetical protein [Ignavibacteria bacterium]
MKNKTRVLEKGMIKIPAEALKKYKLEKSTLLHLEYHDDYIKVIPITEAYIRKNVGALGLKGKMLKSLLMDKKIEREL